MQVQIEFLVKTFYQYWNFLLWKLFASEKARSSLSTDSMKFEIGSEMVGLGGTVSQIEHKNPFVSAIVSMENVGFQLFYKS